VAKTVIESGVGTAYMTLEEAQEILDRADAEGLLTDDDFAKLLGGGDDA
jgi:hypothetical protein